MIHREMLLIAYGLAGRPEKLTIDIDTSIYRSAKGDALFCYDRVKAYQPMMAFCPELQMVVSQVFQGSYHQEVEMALTAARHGLSMSVSGHLYSAAIEFAQTAKIDDETVRADLDRVYLVLAEEIKSWLIEPEVHQAADFMYPLAPDVQDREYEKLINAALEDAQKGDSIKTCIRLSAARDVFYDKERYEDTDPFGGTGAEYFNADFLLDDFDATTSIDTWLDASGF